MLNIGRVDVPIEHGAEDKSPFPVQLLCGFQHPCGWQEHIIDLGPIFLGFCCGWLVGNHFHLMKKNFRQSVT